MVTGRHEVGVAGRVDADPVGAQEGRAPTEVGPALLLHVGHDDEVPLEALGAVGGQQPDGRAADPALGEGVGGQLLGDEAGEERADTDVVALVDRASGQLEEGDDRIEVSVRAPGTGSAEVDLAAQPLGPRGRRPQVPQDVLDAGAVGQHLRAGAQQPGERGGALDVVPVEPVEESRLDHRQPQQLARRTAGVGVREPLLAGAEAAHEGAQVGRVEPAQRREQERLDTAGVEVVGRVGVVVVEVDDGTQSVEERQDSGIAHQREVVGGDLDRYAGGGERTPKRRDAGPSRPHQDSHPLPGDAVLEVGTTKQVGQPLGLGAFGVVGQHLDAAVAVGPGHGFRRQEGLACLGGDAAGQGQPARHPAGGEQDPRAEPTGPAEHHDRRPVARARRETGGEVEDAADVGPAEAVDRLVGVTHDGEVAAVAGQRTEQGDLPGVGVLVLVDEDVVPARPQLVAVRLGLDHRPPDQVGVVGGPQVVEDGEVLLEEQSRRDQLGQVVLDAEAAEAGRVETLLARAGQHRLHLADEAAGADGAAQRLGPDHGLGVVAQQLTQHDVGLGRGEQADRALVELGGGVLPDQRVGEGVEGGARPGGRGARDPRRHPVAQLLGGLAGEGEREDRVGRGTAVLDPVDDRLDEGRRLAGAGSSQHEERAALGGRRRAAGARRARAPRPRGREPPAGSASSCSRGHPITRDRQRCCRIAATSYGRGSRSPRPYDVRAQLRTCRRSRRPGRRPRDPGGQPRPTRRRRGHRSRPR